MVQRFAKFASDGIAMLPAYMRQQHREPGDANTERQNEAGTR